MQEQGASTEERMQEFFLNLYQENVPLSIQSKINEQIQREEMERAAGAESHVKTTAYRVTRNGRQFCFQTDIGSDVLMTALRLKAYLSEPANAGFENLFSERVPITLREYEQSAILRLDSSPKVVGVFELDFDRGEFSCVDSEHGWRTFPLSSVLHAVHRIEQKQGLSHEQLRELLMKNLEGWAVLSPGHLSEDAISFKGEMTNLSGQLFFELDADSDFGSMDAIFETNTCTSENNDFLAVYAGYDTSSGVVYKTLGAELNHEDETTEELLYHLNDVEKECLRRRMEEYCQKQTGMGLTEYSRHVRQAVSPSAQPKALSKFDMLELYADLCIADMAESFIKQQSGEQRAPEAESPKNIEATGHGMGPVMG